MHDCSSILDSIPLRRLLVSTMSTIFLMVHVHPYMVIFVLVSCILLCIGSYMWMRSLTPLHELMALNSSRLLGRYICCYCFIHFVKGSCIGEESAGGYVNYCLRGHSA